MRDYIADLYLISGLNICQIYSQVIKISHSNTMIMHALLFVLNKVPLFLIFRRYIIGQTRKSVHRTRMPPPNAIQKKGLYVTVTGIP